MGARGYGFRLTPPRDQLNTLPPPAVIGGGGGGGGGGTTVTSFQLTTAATTGTYPFVIGMAFAEGDMPSDVTTDLANAQVTIKRRWNDLSVKHAIICGRAALTQDTARTINLSSGSQSTGTNLTSANITAANPSASVQCGSFGTVSLSSLLASPVRTWISNSEMVECHYRGDVGGGTLLSVWFHVRLFVDNRVWIRAIVENGYIDNGAGALASNADRSYVPTITIGGTVVYNHGFVSLSHYQNTRYSAEGWIGGDPQITPSHDVDYLCDSKLLPNYHWRNPSDTPLDALTQTYTQMGRGDLEVSMGATGFAPSLGIIPNWDALYATSGDARAYRSCLANSSHLNSYGIIWRDKTTNLMPKPSSFPTWSIEGPGGGGNTAISRGGLTWEYNHTPAEAYLAYILTGDYWHYETLLAHNAVSYLTLSSGGIRGDGTGRIMVSETRGTGWGLRNMSQLAAIYPTGDAVAAEYQTLLSSNLDHWKSVADAVGSSGNGYLWEDNLILDPPAIGHVRAWMHHFCIQAVGFGSDIEPLADMTNYNVVRDHQYRGIVGILGDSSGFCFTKASAYNIQITADVADYDPADWFDWPTIYAESYARGFLDGASSSCANTLEGGSSGVPGLAYGYWANLMPAIAYAVDHAATGAETSWERVTGATNWSTLRDAGFDDLPVWGITPRDWTDSTLVPAWRIGQSVNEWREISNTKISSMPTYPYHASGLSHAKVSSWVGWSIDQRTSDVYSVSNGGHDDYWGNEVNKISLADDAPAWEELLTSTVEANVTANNDHYADGRPVSRHSYYTQQVIESLDRAFMFGVGSGSTQGFPKAAVDAFHIGTGTFDAAATFAPLPFGLAAGGWTVAKHPTTEDIYCWAVNDKVYKWTKGTPGSWAAISGFTPASAEGSAAAAIDPTRGTSGTMLVAGGNSPLHHTVDLATGVFTAITFGGADASALTSGFIGMGLLYHPELDKYVAVRGEAGAPVYLIDPDTWAVTQLTVTGNGSLPASHQKDSANIVYTRALYVPNLSGIIYGPQFAENLWFLRTH